MPAPRLPVTALCLVAFGVATGLATATTAAAGRSGRPALTQAATELTKALRQAPVDPTRLARVLAPDANLRDPRVRESVLGLARGMAGDAVVLSSKPGGDGRGTTEIAISARGPVRNGAEVVTLVWSRGTDGAWRWDVLAP